MPASKRERGSGYDVNLASEFYVLSCLHRLGLTANLTLGNKKGIDIVVARKAGDAVTVEVKGTAMKYDWVANNLYAQDPSRHFVVLVSFEGQMAQKAMPVPSVWVIPLPEIEPFRRKYAGGRMETISRAAVLKNGAAFKDAWDLIGAQRAD